MARTNNIQLRRGLAADWVTANPVLSSGEYGLETDTRKRKIGDGSSTWNALDYVEIYGSNRVASNDAARTTTTSSTYQTKTSLSTGAVVTTHVYRIDFSCVLDSPSNNTNINFRIFNITNATVLYEAQDIRIAAANAREPVSGFVELSFGTTAARTLALQWNSDNNAATVGAQYAYLSFYRVG
jgi:hypothetical protein